ncbi:hypothetical protein [Zavarzinia sp.]|uniref:hypothetical protein n=1 Tax=Zavarzinia sp. TaxID=2027920 RepID=UPI003562AE99
MSGPGFAATRAAIEAAAGVAVTRAAERLATRVANQGLAVMVEAAGSVAKVSVTGALTREYGSLSVPAAPVVGPAVEAMRGDFADLAAEKLKEAIDGA